MRTVLGRSAGRIAFILVSAGMVGSAVLPAVPAAADGRHPHARHRQAGVHIGTAVKYVRTASGAVHRVR